MPSNLITNGRHTQRNLLATCQDLVDHLAAYAISAEKFDEDAFVACERAERLIFQAKIDSFDASRDGDSLCSDEQ